MNVYFQIGTNDGNDNFKQLCIKNNADMIVLVEPNIKHLNSITQNYHICKNVHIINKAIYYNDNDEVELFIPAKDGIYGNKGVNNHRYSDGEFSLLPMNDWGEKKDMCVITAKTITFDSLCKELNITKIKYLQIDTEGFDSEIIKMIDLDKVDIDTIRYEKWGFDPQSFTRHNNTNTNLDLNRLGNNGMKDVEQKLLKYNYKLTDIVDRYGNDIIASKQKSSIV